MEGLKQIVDEMLGLRAEMDPNERRVRFALLERLFVFYREASKEDVAARMEIYLSETAHVPVDKLALGIRYVLRQHKYPSLPSIADIVSLARALAGMDREQYHAGRYLPVPSQWPPPGKRHAVNHGELETIDPDLPPSLPAGSLLRQRQQLLEAGE